MMNLIVKIWLGLFLSGPGDYHKADPGSPENSSMVETPKPKELCRLLGSVFVTDDPKKAHYYVFVEEYESASDLSVFVEENKLFADQPGHWYYTDIQAFADFVVFFTDNRGMADFKIYYTDVASFAGCKK